MDVGVGDPPGCARQTSAVVVDVDAGSASSWGRDPDRSWLIRLRRGDRSVVMAIGLSRVAADLVAGHISELLQLDVGDGVDIGGAMTAMPAR